MGGDATKYHLTSTVMLAGRKVSLRDGASLSVRTSGELRHFSTIDVGGGASFLLSNDGAADYSNTTLLDTASPLASGEYHLGELSLSSGAQVVVADRPSRSKTKEMMIIKSGGGTTIVVNHWNGLHVPSGARITASGEGYEGGAERPASTLAAQGAGGSGVPPRMVGHRRRRRRARWLGRGRLTAPRRGLF